MRQHVFPQPQLQAAAAGNLHAVFQGLGQIGEQRRHLGRRTQGLLGCVLARAPGIVQQAAAVDAYPHLMRFEIGGVQEAHVVGGHHGHAGTTRQINGGRQIDRLVGMADAAQFQVVAIPEQGRGCSQQRPRLCLAAGEERSADRAFPPSGERNQAIHALLIQPAPLQQRETAALALAIQSRDQPGQMTIASGILAQQGQAAGRLGLPFVNPQVDSGDGLDALAPGCFVELHQTEQIGLVGDADGRHVQLARPSHQRLDTHHPIHQGILGMYTQMDEGDRHNVASARARRTGAKLSRWIGLGPWRIRVSRWAAVA